MVTKNSGNIALLSIHPMYVECILTGKKRVEFRRRNFKKDVDHVVIYSTSPVKKIVGYFDINRIVVDKPTSLWRNYKEIGSIDWNSFRTYFKGVNDGVAIEIGDVFTLNTPIDLKELNSRLAVPQNYVYLDNTDFNRLNEVAEKIV